MRSQGRRDAPAASVESIVAYLVGAVRLDEAADLLAFAPSEGSDADLDALRIVLAMREQRPDDATTAAARAAQRWSEHAFVAEVLADVLLWNGQAAAAESAYRRRSALDPERLSAYMDISMALASQGEIRRAECIALAMYVPDPASRPAAVEGSLRLCRIGRAARAVVVPSITILAGAVSEALGVVVALVVGVALLALRRRRRRRVPIEVREVIARFEAHAGPLCLTTALGLAWVAWVVAIGLLLGLGTSTGGWLRWALIAAGMVVSTVCVRLAWRRRRWERLGPPGAARSWALLSAMAFIAALGLATSLAGQGRSTEAAWIVATIVPLGAFAALAARSRRWSPRSQPVASWAD